jgi:integrase
VAAAIRAAADARDTDALSVGQRTPTVGEWMTTRVDTVAAARVRPSTLATYRGYVVTRIIPELAHLRLDRRTVVPDSPRSKALRSKASRCSGCSR